MDSLATLATEHFVLHFQPLHRVLQAAVENQRITASSLSRQDLKAFCITDEQVKVLLEHVDFALSGSALPGCPISLNAEESAMEDELRARCAAIGGMLPLDRLVRELSLSPFEVDAILVCAAPELDRNYERIFAFILDDLNRRFPCVELIISLTSVSIEERIARQNSLSSAGKLRRFGVLVPFGEPPTELRQELRLGPGVFEFLTGASRNFLRLSRDRAEVTIPSQAERPPQVSQQEFFHFSDALANGTLTLLGIWGPRQNGAEELVLSLASRLGCPLRKICPVDLDRNAFDPVSLAQDCLRTASRIGAAVWVDTDAFVEPTRERILDALEDLLAGSPVPVFLTGENPWRPRAILRSGSYAEIILAAPPSGARALQWSRCLPDIEATDVEHFASRYSLSGEDIRAVSGLARMRARLAGNGRPEPVKDHLADACSLITQRSTAHFGILITPRRSPSDLVLPANLHRQVLEIASFYDLGSRVDDDWGFGRVSSSCGTKALFTGDPGTGKTLAAEVVAGLVGLPLLKVDLARIVSKWVGETEKNLESAFREAEDCYSVLFFDEAEALFGKRAEVQHGTDRYANLEVSYLLQRLEASRSLVILASNVRDQIDTAFIRRFHVVVHFPKPSLNERLRIWQGALPKSAPLDDSIDLNALARLDMTGAAIVNSARTAALLAAESGAEKIRMDHLVRATARQFRREARVLTPAELGNYGVMLQGAS